MCSHAADCADSYGVVAAKNQRHEFLFQAFLNNFGQVFTGFGDFRHVLGALFTDRHFFRLLDGDVADVFDLMTKVLQARLQSCDP
jgi:hypothetical protein